MSETVAMRARITGRVQGVNFRGWTRDRARGLGLTGWVRNEPDGSVSALFAGPPHGVREMEQALWQGPRAARVMDVTAEACNDEPWPDSFEIRR